MGDDEADAVRVEDAARLIADVFACFEEFDEIVPFGYCERADGFHARFQCVRRALPESDAYHVERVVLVAEHADLCDVCGVPCLGDGAAVLLYPVVDALLPFDDATPTA